MTAAASHTTFTGTKYIFGPLLEPEGLLFSSEAAATTWQVSCSNTAALCHQHMHIAVIGTADDIFVILMYISSLFVAAQTHNTVTAQLHHPALVLLLLLLLPPQHGAATSSCTADARDHFIP
jgi:hypothetical protein